MRFIFHFFAFLISFQIATAQTSITPIIGVDVFKVTNHEIGGIDFVDTDLIKYLPNKNFQSPAALFGLKVSHKINNEMRIGIRSEFQRKRLDFNTVWTYGPPFLSIAFYQFRFAPTLSYQLSDKFRIEAGPELTYAFQVTASDKKKEEAKPSQEDQGGWNKQFRNFGAIDSLVYTLNRWEVSASYHQGFHYNRNDIEPYFNPQRLSSVSLDLGYRFEIGKGRK